MGEGFQPRRRTRERRRFSWKTVAGLALLLAIPMAGQFGQFPSENSGRNGQIYQDPSDQAGHESNSPEKKRINLLNVERQKTIVSDAEKLLKLAKELNDEVAANDSAPLSGQQLHKLDEIGKLAKSVKEKMSFSTGGFPSLNSPLTIQPAIH